MDVIVRKGKREGVGLGGWLLHTYTYIPTFRVHDDQGWLKGA